MDLFNFILYSQKDRFPCYLMIECSFLNGYDGVPSHSALTEPRAVLLVDPNPNMRDLMCDFLGHAGFTVETSCDQCVRDSCGGCDAALAMAASDWRAVIIGCQTPQDEHVEFTRRVREVNPGAALAVISEGAVLTSIAYRERLGLVADVLFDRDFHQLVAVVEMSPAICMYRQQAPRSCGYPPFMEKEFPLLAGGWVNPVPERPNGKVLAS